MLAMTVTDVRLGAAFASREAAIRGVGELLLESDAIEPEYIESMLARERLATTYLENGLAIPHGRRQDAGRIKQTHVAVVQIPAGVAWQDDKTAHLVFGIAARSNEHLGLLRQLNAIVADAALADRLAHTTDPAEILAAVCFPDDAGGDVAEADPDFAGSELELAFTNPRGVHLLSAGKFARAVQAYPGKVTLAVRRREIEAGSISSILALGITAGDAVRVRVSGDDETETLSCLAALLEEINNEPLEESRGGNTVSRWNPGQKSCSTLEGVTAAPGLAIAPVWKWEPVGLGDRQRARGDSDSEIATLRAAVSTARGQLLALAEASANPVQRGLLEAHAALVEDPAVKRESEAMIARGDDALCAWKTIIESRARRIAALDDVHFAQRAADIRDAGQRVQKILLGVDLDSMADVSGPVILVADDLEPSEAAQLKADKIKGICLKKGSPNAHGAIVSRSLGIPMLVALGAELDKLPPGEMVILDATGGRLLPRPGAADLQSATAAIAEDAVLRNFDWDHRFEPAILRDGHRVEVAANIGKTSEGHAVIDSGAEGVGLYRTEFLFFGRDQAPDEEEQYQALREIIEALHGLPMIVRTLDIGGDKPVSYLGLSMQDLSVLGLRGFRLSLACPDLAKAQLRAIFRAAEHGPIRLMFPMIATPNDFLRAREMTEKVRREVGGKKLALGVMIEVPSAVTMAPELAELADFFSIGTNDLTQYTLAVDRSHPLLARHGDSLHPAVLRLIRAAVQAAHDKGKWVGVCGGLAAEPLGALLLTGLGVDELSMPPAVVPQIKALLRREEIQQLRELARKALDQRDALAVRALRPGL